MSRVQTALAAALAAAGIAAAVVAAGPADDDSGTAPVTAAPGVVPATHDAGRRVEARWVFRPDSLAALSRRAEVAFEGTVESIDGAPLKESDHHTTPSAERQTVTLRVEDPWFGTERGATFAITKLEFTEATIGGDPRYRVGERYVWFLDRGRDGQFGLAAPDGRLRVDDGRLAPVIDGPVANELRGT